jgi:Phytanoyl-CoA dioxygenase (PhyH)
MSHSIPLATRHAQFLEPSSGDVDFFQEHGWWVSPRLFSSEEIAAAREHAMRVFQGIFETGEKPQIIHPLPHPKGLRKIDNAWFADRVLAAIATSPRIGRIAAMLTGFEEIYLWHDQLLWKPGPSEAFANVGWHQDKGDWEASSTSEMLTAWVALDDTSEVNGALRFVDRSHAWGKVAGRDFLTHSIEERARIVVPHGETWHEVPAILQAGQVSFHHCQTIHGIAPNPTHEPRRSLAVHLMSGAARIVRGSGHPNEALTNAPHGAPWRGSRFPRLWPEGRE